MDSDARADDLTILGTTPRMSLARWPTPVKRSRSGVWVKRDDLCAYGRGGAKARKIEGVLGHMIAESRDELITVAGNVTNLAFDLLPALDRAGIRPHLLIADDPPAPPAARREIFAGIAGRVELIGSGRLGAALRALAAYRAGRRAGRRPFLLLPGASHPAAVLGSAGGFVEMVEQFQATGRDPPRTVFVSAATGSTLAGFLIGENALRARGHPPIRIIGVQVYPGRVRRRTWALIRWTERFARLAGRVPFGRIEIDASALGQGFGRFTTDIARTCDRVARDAGLAIDPIFGGKTWQVMQRMRREKRVDDPVLFWHCGFTPEWRSLGSKLAERRRVS